MQQKSIVIIEVLVYNDNADNVLNKNNYQNLKNIVGLIKRANDG